MFYSQFILAKKGPLGTIWIAAHLERKLRKNQVADTDIGVSVDSILFPEMPIALRLSSHLLLGVVRIYSKKVNYLFDDCSEALLKVKQAFRSTAVDLPPEETTAPYHSITLPETFDLDDFELPDNDLQGDYVDQHISSKDQITLQDTMEGVVYSTSKFGLDERFGDDDASGLDLDEELLTEKAATPELATGASNSDDNPQASDHANASGILNQHLDEYDGDNEPVDYAQAPCTPGLWEEPNLSNIQETSACEDHQEPENHAITESAVKENLENVFPHERNNQFESHDKSTQHVAETEQMIHDLGSTPFAEPISTETVIPVPNDPAKMENLLNKNVRDEDPEFHPANNNQGNFVEYQGNQDPGVQTGNDRFGNFVQYQGNQQNTFHLTTELESNTGKDNLVGTPQHPSSLEPKDSSTPVLFPHDSMPNSNFSSLRPCTTFLNHETNVGSHATEALNRNFSETHHAEFDHNNQVQMDDVIQREMRVESINSYTNNFPAHVAQKEFQVENINNYTNDFPAPEKRLSLPHWLSDVPKNFVPESTPIEKDITSGKNRSFTESSMTDHSLNLNESSGLFNINMTPQSLNLNASSGFYATNMTGQSLNSNASSGFYTTSMTAQSLNLNQSSGFFTTNTTAQSLNLNQSSGFFSTNTAGQSLNLNQSSGFFSTNTDAQSLNLNKSSDLFTLDMTGQSVVNDDDLLSSILVGRKSSILKMKPSPPIVTPSTKRGRPAAPKTAVPKNNVPKRKALMDDNMVLHGDTIRQQLVNTEDIRRLRKKAPCTRSEISMLEKQFWEDEIFSEPIFIGVSVKLASLHKQLYNLSKIVVSRNDDVSLEGGKDPKLISQNDEKGTQVEVGSNVPKEIADVDPVAQPIEFPMVTDTHTCDNNTVSLDYYGSQTSVMAASEHVAEPFNSEHDLFGKRTAMEIDPKIFPDAHIGVSVMTTEVETLTHADVVPSDTFDMSAGMSEVQVDASLQIDAPGVNSTGKTDLQPADMDKNNFKSLESNISYETNIDVAPVKEISEEKHNQDIEYRKNEEDIVNEDAALASNIESNVQNSVYNGIFGEEFGIAAAYETEVDRVLENVPLDITENQGLHVTFENIDTNVEDIPSSNRVNNDEFTHPAVENDTDFLNFDDVDDDEADAGGDYVPDVDATRVIDNSGWSSRTKAVAKYLQIMFDKEGVRGRNTLAVNNLLVGKTRKEASRMFFETLVLKTKDYIHVEQPDPFENINIFPRAKLLKSDF